MNLLLVAFFLYLFATIAFIVSITGQKWRSKGTDVGKRLGTVGIVLTLLALLCHASFIVYRIFVGGFFPTSNMFEFMSFLGFCIAVAFVLIYKLYKVRVIGAFALPLVLVLIGYASVFPTEIKPLVPSLQSYWLYIHVTLVALGNGAFGVAFVAGLIYLIRTVDRKTQRASAFFLEAILAMVIMVVAFVGLSFAFEGLVGYEASYEHTVVDANTQKERVVVDRYDLPPIFIQKDAKTIEAQPFLGMKMGWIETSFLNARKLNSLVWSIAVGLLLYGLIRLIARKPLGEALKKGLVKGIDAEMAEEISYRAIAIGYPIFILGGLIFASIWAHYAWGRFWGWDPKEVWALITFLFYSLYLHLRLSRGWHGKKSAWFAVAGFVVVMFNLVVVNLVIAGLHSYA